ncbi:MAG TPA: flippase activity-associated protein Agl23 [Chthonomonadaceae bacterium]|nr:flippase activity-associated protein Agl23 [Chthonomonadaceae bacterium]
MKHPGAFVAVLLLLTLGALALRLPDLGSRPFHGDEAVHAVKFQELWEKGVYRYDPNEYHGPTIYYAALPSVWLHGRHTFAETQETDYRLPIVIVGALMLLFLWPLADGMGRRSALCAGLLLTLSPAFVFYSRYYIQETFLACFTLGMLACGWRYARSRRPGWLLAAGLCTGLMIASKETAVLTFVACGLALGLTALWTRRVDGEALALRPLWSGRWIAAALGVGLLTACLFLSGFFSHPAGALDYLHAYTPWLHRAGGTEIHRHPWNYYLGLLLWNPLPHHHLSLLPTPDRMHHPFWSEALIVGLAGVGGIVALLPKEKSPLEGSAALARFLAFTTLLLTLVYSIIPYKTPWCVLSFLLGMVLLAGIGAIALLRNAPGTPLKALIGLLLLAGGVQLGWQSYQSSYLHNTDQSSPYVYSQPVQDIAELGQEIEKLAAASPQHDQMVIKVFSVDEYYWPLPWYLRRFPNVGYWTEVPKDADAPVVLASPEFEEELTKRLDATHIMRGYRGLRPGVFLELWVRMDLWEAYLKAKKATEKEAPE